VSTSNNRARTLALLAIGLLILIAGACARQPRGAPQGSEQTSAPADPAIEVSPADIASSSDDPCSQMFSNFFIKADSISYNKYEVVRLRKTVHDEEAGRDIPITYAVLKSDGKIIATFDGMYFGAGNATDFGFASLLGGDMKQLIVSQTVPHGGRHWIVALSSVAVTLFDSKDWDLGNEDVCVHDFDGDGVDEISLAITKFWGFGSMSMSESPLPCVLFKYEPRIRKYLPDESALVRGLDHIDEEVQRIDPGEKPQGASTGPYFATRLDIFLRYVYAGHERDGWSFFDKTYNLGNKEEIKQKIRATLDREPVYRFVYGRARASS